MSHPSFFCPSRCLAWSLLGPQPRPQTQNQAWLSPRELRKTTVTATGGSAAPPEAGFQQVTRSRPSDAYYLSLTLTHNQLRTAPVWMYELHSFQKLMGNILKLSLLQKSIWLIENRNPLSINEYSGRHFELLLLPDKTMIILECSQYPMSPFDHLRRLIDLAYLLFYFLII